jgi:hypothetical protein
MRFKDLKFRIHPWTKRGIHATVETSNNISISIVAGHGFYSSPGGLHKDEEEFKLNPEVSDFTSFEVGIKDRNLPVEEQEWQVLNWQGEKEINQILKKYSK